MPKEPGRHGRQVLLLKRKKPRPHCATNSVSLSPVGVVVVVGVLVVCCVVLLLLLLLLVC